MFTVVESNNMNYINVLVFPFYATLYLYSTCQAHHMCPTVLVSFQIKMTPDLCKP